MIDAVLDRKKVDLKVKITVKTAVSVAVVALAVILPQIVHMTLGANGGAQWLPMYLEIHRTARLVSSIRTAHQCICSPK